MNLTCNDMLGEADFKKKYVKNRIYFYVFGQIQFIIDRIDFFFNLERSELDVIKFVAWPLNFDIFSE